MHWVIYLFGSGLAFFLGLLCTLIALAVAGGRWRGWPRVSTIVALLGIALLVVSGTPLPIWYYALTIAILVAWLVAIRLPSKVTPPRAQGMRVLAATVLLGGAIGELPYQFSPTVPPVEGRRLDLFGDSLSAGFDEHEPNHWPDILARMHSIELINYSRPGATVAVALRQAKETSLGEGVVLLEIGGNDVLGSTSSTTYADQLEELLQIICQPGKQVVMFELPLPPLYNEFGRIQRRLAAQYHVLLIPKRVLVDVIARGGATLDSIHLTERGHRRMADVVWKIIGPAYE